MAVAEPKGGIIAHPVTKGTFFFALEWVEPEHSILLAVHVCLLVRLAECENHFIRLLLDSLMPPFNRHKAEADQGCNHDLRKGCAAKRTDE